MNKSKKQNRTYVKESDRCVPVSLSLPKSMKTRLRRLAKEQNLSLSSLTVRLLRKAVQSEDH